MDKNNKPALAVEDMENMFRTSTDADGMRMFLMNKTVFFKNTDVASIPYDVHITRFSETWPVISYKHYGTVGLWWLVCKVNGVVDPFTMPKPGTSLKILRKNMVYNTLLPMLKSMGDDR